MSNPWVVAIDSIFAAWCEEGDGSPTEAVEMVHWMLNHVGATFDIESLERSECLALVGEYIDQPYRSTRPDPRFAAGWMIHPGSVGAVVEQ